MKRSSVTSVGITRLGMEEKTLKPASPSQEVYSVS